MVGKFAYSFDRETFHGLFDTRQDAFRNGIVKLRDLETSPDMIYVGKHVPVDPGTSGLAEMVLGAMRRRLREELGADATKQLLRVNEHQLAELDDTIDKVLRDWLNKHDLMPTQSKIQAISEHPVPQPTMVKTSDNGEVTEIGEAYFTL